MCTDCGCSSPLPQLPQIAPGRIRTIRLEQNLLTRNAATAALNRAYFLEHALCAINLLAAPGAGKTTLLETTLRTLKAKRPDLRLSVIEGDQQTSLDAERIRATEVPAIQINTGQGCHLDARMVLDAVKQMEDSTQGGPKAQTPGFLFIENVGNLVCPALWDLGETAKVVVFSVTEGAEKPLKYPDMFAAASLILINKIDLLPYVDFDLDSALDACRRVNPGATLLKISSTQGTGIDDWIHWLVQNLRQRPTQSETTPCASPSLRAS